MSKLRLYARKGEFVMLVSKVGDSHKFRVKTIFETYKCGRIFVNKNANKEWVLEL